MKIQATTRSRKVVSRSARRGWRALVLALGTLAPGCASVNATPAPRVSGADVHTALAAERAASLGRPREGAELYGALRARHPEDTYVRAREAALWHAAGEEARAASLLGAPELAGTVEALLVRARIAAAEGDVDGALARFAEARQRASDDPRPRVEAIELARARGRSQEADALVDEALAAGMTLPRGVIEARLHAAVDAGDERATRRVAEALARAYPPSVGAIVRLAASSIEREPSLALALLAGLPDTFEVTGAELAAREALRSRRRSR